MSQEPLQRLRRSLGSLTAGQRVRVVAGVTGLLVLVVVAASRIGDRAADPTGAGQEASLRSGFSEGGGSAPAAARPNAGEGPLAIPESGAGEAEASSTETEASPEASAAMALRRAIERRMEDDLVALLEPLVGEGRVRVHASVELNLSRVRRVLETYDPDVAVVRSERRRDDGDGGTVTEFDVNKTVATIEEPVGSVARQSVAVVLDHVPVEATDELGNSVVTAEPRSPTQMRRITELVRAAVGYDELRGDVLIVENLPFDRVSETDPSLAENVGRIAARFEVLLWPLALLVSALLIGGPLWQLVRRSEPDEPDELDTEDPAAGLRARLIREPAPELEAGALALRDQLLDATRRDPPATARVVRDWLRG